MASFGLHGQFMITSSPPETNSHNVSLETPSRHCVTIFIAMTPGSGHCMKTLEPDFRCSRAPFTISCILFNYTYCTVLREKIFSSNMRTNGNDMRRVQASVRAHSATRAHSNFVTTKKSRLESF